MYVFCVLNRVRDLYLVLMIARVFFQATKPNLSRDSNKLRYKANQDYENFTLLGVQNKEMHVVDCK